MIKRKNDNKWKYICGVLIIILVLGGLLSQLHTSNIQAKIKIGSRSYTTRRTK